MMSRIERTRLDIKEWDSGKIIATKSGLWIGGLMLGRLAEFSGLLKAEHTTWGR